MTGNSNFVISWVLNNSTSNGSSGKVESEAIDEGGFRWSATIEKTVQNELSDFTLRCEVDHNGSWKCQGGVSIHLIKDGKSIFDSKKDSFCFDEENSKWQFESNLRWAYIANLTHIVNNKFTVEFRINITISDRGESIEAKLLNDRSDVVLKFGERRLSVSREYLAVHSPVFAAMFFGDFAEKRMKEVEINDVEYEEFLDLLNLIYLGTLKITDRKVLHILKLADRFQLQRVFDLSKDHLLQSKGIDVVTKLSLADQYRIAPLRDNCLQSFINVAEMHEKLKASPEYDNFSADMKIAICDRIMQLKLLMTDNSFFVLHWEIDNATARFATGKVVSAEYEEGGFRWTAGVERRADLPADKMELSLQCGVDHDAFWKCEAAVEPFLCRESEKHNFFSKKDFFCFEEKNNCWIYKTPFYWSSLNLPGNRVNDNVILQFHINIISSENCEPMTDLAKFAVPNNRSDVVLKIGDEKLHVSKELLALHSPVFETMFFGDFAEKGKEEVEIKDVVYEEFLDLLHLIYPRTTRITARKVLYILKLADRFQMEGVLYLLSEHLIRSQGFSATKKLLLADQYRLDSLRAQILQSFSNVSTVLEMLESSPEFGDFSEGMKAVLLERIVKLKSY